MQGKLIETNEKALARLPDLRERSVLDIINTLEVSNKAGALLIPPEKYEQFKSRKSDVEKLTRKVFIIKKIDGACKIWRTE